MLATKSICSLINFGLFWQGLFTPTSTRGHDVRLSYTAKVEKNAHCDYKPRDENAQVLTFMQRSLVLCTAALIIVGGQERCCANLCAPQNDNKAIHCWLQPNQPRTPRDLNHVRKSTSAQEATLRRGIRRQSTMKPSTVRRYGKQQKKSKGDRLFAELPQTPNRLAVKTAKLAVTAKTDITIEDITEQVTALDIQDENSVPTIPEEPVVKTPVAASRRRTKRPITPVLQVQEPTPEPDEQPQEQTQQQTELLEPRVDAGLSVLSWPEICPAGDRIVKIAEASYAEVYRVTNERGTSIIKVIRMQSPIKPQTKAQEKSGLVDEQPHSESDLIGELKISEWLADIPGFVMYKERYIVQGKACRELLETHQAFHKKAKRQDPGRLQFYPSPSRYLDGTKFLVVELGDAGVALEDFQLESADQIWDIFFHVSIALARAEAQIEFEVSKPDTRVMSRADLL